MLNWITIIGVFVFSIIWLPFLSNRLLTNKEHKIKDSIKTLKTISRKNISDQKKYLNLKKQEAGFKPNRFISIIMFLGTILCFNIMTAKLTDYVLSALLLIMLSFCIGCFMSIISSKPEYVLHNANTYALMLFFINSFILINRMQPLYLGTIKMSLLYMLPILYVIKIVVEKLILKKVLKRG